MDMIIVVKGIKMEKYKHLFHQTHLRSRNHISRLEKLLHLDCHLVCLAFNKV
jgi:hypothetical protein